MRKKTLKALLLTFCILSLTRVSMSQNNSEPKRYDIVISEIMAKPAPEIGLPAVEYLEQHNRLPYPCLLQNWRLTLGNTSKTLPNITLDSCGFAVIIAQKNLDAFSSVCDNVYTLSSLAITDGGQKITLMNRNNEVIHFIDFRSSWHTESIKQEGGWSLEMIDDGWPCAGKWNWNSSSDPLGGTPGRPNSIRNALIDHSRPMISGATMPDSVTLRVHFSKTLSPEVLQQDDLFQTTPHLNIIRVAEVPPAFDALDIRFETSLQHGTNYRLQLAGDLYDCGGNAYRSYEEIPFGSPSTPSQNELVINEILTNPRDNEHADYIEIFNRSDHFIDLKEVKIGYGGDTLPQKAVLAVSKGWQLGPKSYATLCKERDVTREQYFCKDESRLIECDSLPDFAIGSGIIHLTDKSLRPIDKFAYSEEMHYSKLLTTKGVALERLSVDRPTQDENNWRSAAESAGFGTPGYENSQCGSMTGDDDFEIAPEVFSPDNDGYDDFSEIHCKFTEGENRVSICIFNTHGHLVKILANNILCGNDVHLRWDGDDEKFQPAPAGMYVVQFECWNLRTKKTIRKRKVVSIYR